jgi:hypothetical protein
MKMYTMLCSLALMSSNFLYPFVIYNDTDYDVTFSIVAPQGCTSTGHTINSGDTLNLPQGCLGYHVEVGLDWGDNSDWSATMKNKNTIVNGKFWYKKIDDDRRTFWFKMNSDYNAPVLWDATAGQWVYQIR